MCSHVRPEEARRKVAEMSAVFIRHNTPIYARVNDNFRILTIFVYTFPMIGFRVKYIKQLHLYNFKYTTYCLRYLTAI